VNIGDIAPMKSCKVSFGSSEFGFKAINSKSGDRLMFLYLGSHNKNDGKFNPEAALIALGWTPPKSDGI